MAALTKLQLQLVVISRVVESLCIMSINSYVFFMVKDVAPQLSDSEIARTITTLIASYNIAQFCTNIFWGWVSDQIGCKPILLLGYFSISIGSIGLAFSDTLGSIFFFRLLVGLLCSNYVVLRTLISESVEGRNEKAKALAMGQTVYQIGSILGPSLGGVLARPCHQYPGLCDNNNNGLLKKYPYSAPNLAVAVLSLVSFAIIWFCVDEPKRHLGKTLDENECEVDEHQPLLENEDRRPKTRASFLVAFTYPVVQILICYIVVSLHNSCYDAVFSSFLSAPPDRVRPPFIFNGGLGYDTDVVATFLSAAGLISVTLLIFSLPIANLYWNSLVCIKVSASLFPIIYAAVPYLLLLSSYSMKYQATGVVFLMTVRGFATMLISNEIAVVLNDVSPKTEYLGLINGMAQTGAAFGKAIGPSLMGEFIVFGDGIGSQALGWFFLTLVAAIGLFQSLLVDDKPAEAEVDVFS